ncbi:MAG: hypothetical protein MJE68_03545 [Proteobacteria bacterium]|nr:hypothetical protein [Pseudomonadota bacterium]
MDDNLHSEEGERYKILKLYTPHHQIPPPNHYCNTFHDVYPRGVLLYPLNNNFDL